MHVRGMPAMRANPLPVVIASRIRQVRQRHRTYVDAEFQGGANWK